MNNNTFSQFINIYQLSKTLRFELKPMDNTQRLLEENNVFQKDKLIKQKYKKTKVFFDKLHREFASDSLKKMHFNNEDLEEYERIFLEWGKNKKNTVISKKLEKQEKKLYKFIANQFDVTGRLWAQHYNALARNKQRKLPIKKQNKDFLYEESVFEYVLLPKYRTNDDGTENKDTIETVEVVNKKTGEVETIEQSIFEGWKGFAGYFSKFFETRKNFYKADGTATAIATRIVDNLKRFISNKTLLKKYPEDFLQRLPADKVQKIQHLSEYSQFILQGNRSLKDEKNESILPASGLNLYNEIVGQIKWEINQFRQNPKNRNQENKKTLHIPYLKTLDKQILSEQEKFIEEISSERDLREKLENLLVTGTQKTKIFKKLLNNFVKNQENYDLNKIYLAKKGFETISRKFTTQHSYEWEEKLAEVFKENGIKLTKKKNNYFNLKDFIPFDYLKKSLDKFSVEDQQSLWKNKYINSEDNNLLNTIDISKSIWEQFLEILSLELDKLFSDKFINNKGKVEIRGYTQNEEKLENLLNIEELKADKETKIIVKNFADSLLSFYQFAKYFAVEKKKNWDNDVKIDDRFYENSEFGFRSQFYHDTYETIIQPYNLLRNYLTKKPWESVQKWKVNFGLPTLADGWDKNKESSNGCVILKKENKFFLGVMKKGHTHLFTGKNKEKFFGNGYKKMVYKLLPGANKMLPKVFFSALNIDFFNPSERVLKIRNHSSHTKGGQPQKGYEKKDFNLQDCHILIDFFKKSLAKHLDWKIFNFQFSETSTYTDISDFYREVEFGGYNIFWENISEEYITEKNKSGELFLFQIKNKDWNEGSTGAKNLHTLYFENLFSDTNARQNFVMKMNGQAELFFRPKAIEVKEETRNFKRKIIAKKRYTQDKIFFHLPITLNRGAGRLSSYQFNDQINEFLANNPDINVIGIDRGEKHLAYYSVVTQKGEILESGSLNIFGNTDYHYLLEKKANEREKQRKDWQSVQGIKDLKAGYISQVVKKIADLAVKHNAIIVLEDLNMRFKQIRGGIEKSVYQQLEKGLIDKLNFLADKNRKADEIGGILKAYQLTAPCESFKDMGKQTGTIFYTTAQYTSKIDPITGWRPNVYFKKGNAKINKANILKFDEIFWNADKNRFEITYDLKKIIDSDKAKYPSKTVWTVCSSVERWETYRDESTNNQWAYRQYPETGENSITQKLKDLFEKYIENFNISGNILDQIKKINENEKKDATFFSEFLKFFRLICQIRNTDGNLHQEIKNLKDVEKFDAKNPEIAQKIFDEDFILSPVEREKGFFDSRNSEKFSKNLPRNGDDNGAFNIARKGIITLKRISEWATALREKRSKKNQYPELYIANSEWDNFTQK